MENITGRIEKVTAEKGLSKKDNSPFTRYVFVIADKKYSTFDEKIGTAFVAGDFVTMEGTQNGQYWNMKTMVKANPEAIQITKKEPANNTEVIDLLRQILAELRSMGANRE